MIPVKRLSTVSAGSTQAKYNGEFYQFDGTLDNLSNGPDIDFKQIANFNHPFKLCVGGIVNGGTTCVIEQLGQVISSNGNCTSITLPSAADTLWYVCTIDGHDMYKQIYPPV